MAAVVTESLTVKRVNFQSSEQLQSRSSLPPDTVPDNSLDNVVEDYTDNSSLYPLNRILKELTVQEKQLWDRTMGIHIPVEDGSSQLGGDEELFSVGGVSMFGHGSQSALTEPSMTYLIRYGQLTSNVHQYFRKLEKEHACLYLSGRKANFDNNLRRLQHDQSNNSSRSTPVSNHEVDAPIHHNRRNVRSLRDEELVVYRCAIMCAQFPMLSAPTPPDGRSPSPPLPPPLLSHTAPSESSIVMGSIAKPIPIKPVLQVPGNDTESKDADSTTGSSPESNTNMDQEAEPITVPMTSEPNGRRLSESPKGFIPIGAKRGNPQPIRVKGRRRSYSFSDSEDENDELDNMIFNSAAVSAYCDQLGIREQPFPPMVNRDMLCSLVRRSFDQTEEQQVQYEQILRHEYSRKSKGEILARELVTQLEVLESNAHPFYKPRNFVTRNGYDIWLQGEKQRLKQQLDKFWHFNLPSGSYNTRIDYHKAYTTLLEKIICCESKSSRREPVHGGCTPSSPLTPTAQRLLTEFGLRYGIGELYQRIVYLDYLAKHFDYEIWYISHCTDELKAIRNLIPHNRAKMTATRREMELLRGIVHHLHGQVDNSLTRIDRLFQDSEPQVGVASLINLLKEVLEAEHTLFGQRIRPMEGWLKRYLKEGFVLRYERRKEIISVEVFPVQNPFGFALTPILINALLQEIKDEVKYYKDNFQNVFRLYFNIVPFAKMEFYRLTCADACQLCAKLVHEPISRQKLNLEMLGLLYRLDKCDNDWSNDIPTEMQQWRNEFVHLALIWMDVLAKQVNNWVLAAIKEDQWTVLKFAASTPASDLHPTDTNRHAGSHYRVSPFSSIMSPSIVSPPVLTPHSQSAFTAVQPSKSYRAHLSPMSEVSGAISEITSSHSSFENISIEIQRQHEQNNHSSSSPPTTARKSKKKKRGSDDSYLKFGKATPSVDTGNCSSETPKLTNHITAWEDEEEEERRGDTLSPVVREREEESVTPHVSPIPVHDNISTTEEEEEEVKRKPFTGLVPGTSLIGNGFDSSASESSPNVPPFRRFVSCQDPPTRLIRDEGEEGKKERERKLQSKSFDTLPKLPTMNKLPSHPPPISLLKSERPHPPANEVQPSDSTTSITTGPSLSPSLNPPSPSLSTTAIFYTLPVSNSPIDLITIFTRLGSFVGNLMEVLTPKVRQGLKMGLNETAELPTEVNQIRRFLTDIRQQSDNMRIEFLKKIHKTMVNSLKLYTDNILCMDLCYLPQGEAKALFGEEMIHHLQRRNSMDEIWGCRHIVEANHGLHPDGLPCQKKTQPLFDNITRDMCIRINNIHLIMKTFSSLENHIYKLMLSPSNHAPFGPSLSSEASGSALGLDASSEVKSQLKTSRPFPHRYRPEGKRGGHLELLPQDNGSDNSSGLTPVLQRRSETGFNSTEAQQLIDYLSNAQKHQLQMVCLRMNKFFKPALSLLLNLRLGDCPINRRLYSLVAFLERHMSALSKHLYPKCYDSLLSLLWQTILQDIEEEALQLRTEKTSVYRAQLLLQTVTHLIKVVHFEGRGLSLDILTTSTEYLLALVDVYLKPTGRLIKAFEKLTGPQFTQAGTHIQLGNSPVPLTPSLLHQLSLRLHTIRKCFRGQDFVSELIQLGEERGGVANHSNSEAAPNAVPLSYTVTSATQLGQFLLDEGILICLLDYAYERATPLESSSNERMNAISTSRHVEDASGDAPPPPTSPDVRPDSNQSYGYSSSSSLTPPLPNPPQFVNGSNCWYKFSDLEDSFKGAFFHGGQILSTCIKTPAPNNKRRTVGGANSGEGTELTPFDEARLGTVHLILDVLQQRSRKEPQAKSFLSRPNVIFCSQERGRNDVPPLKIFRV